METPVADAELDLTPWLRKLGRMEASLKSRARLLDKAFSVGGLPDLIQHFSKEEGPRGPWPKRKAFTQTWYQNVMTGKWRPPKGVARAAFNPANKLLQLTGALRKALLIPLIRTFGPDAIEVVARTSYAGKHDKGEGGLPRRQFMWLSDKAKRLMAKVVAGMVAEA